MKKFFELVSDYLPIVIPIIILTVGCYGAGYLMANLNQVCPGDKECTLEGIKSSDAEKAQFCASLMPEAPVVTELCEPIYVPKYIATYTECDCTMDTEIGRVNGWAECVEAQNMVTDDKKEKSYCEEHYCQEKILRNTRPNTGR